MSNIPELMKRKVQLWTAINAYAEACGGKTGREIISSERMDAVVAVERVVFGTESGDTEQQLANTQRVLRAVQRRNTMMHKAYKRLIAIKSAFDLALELHSERTQRDFQACIGERLFTESEVRPLVDTLKALCDANAEYLPGDRTDAIEYALAHAKELGL